MDDYIPYATCRLKPDNYYWTVFNYEGTWHKEGHTSSQKEALEAVEKAGGTRRYPDYWARKRRSEAIQAKKVANGSDSQLMEYVYFWNWDCDEVLKCPIIKRTKKRIFIYFDRYFNKKVISLNLDNLEAGRIWSSAARESFYLEPPIKKRQGLDSKLIAIECPFTMAELKTSYHKASLIHHPDRGGDPLTFLELNKEYESLKLTLEGKN